MTLDDIYAIITRILRETFDDDTIEAHAKLTASDVDGWDSFVHLRVMMQVENEFGVKFSASQMSSFASVGDLARSIQVKKASS